MDSMRCSDGCTPEILLIDFVSHPEETLVMRIRCHAVSCEYASQTPSRDSLEAVEC